MSISRHKSPKYYVAVVGILLAVTLCCYIYYQIRKAHHAERAFHAVRLVVDVTANYVKENDGMWPPSWQALETSRQYNWAMFSWPRDSKIVQQYVFIDFDIQSEELLHKNPQEIKVITPIGPCYEGYEEFFVSLLEAIRAALERKGVTKKSQGNRSP